MKNRIPNLFSKPDAERDYSLYLARLMMRGDHERIIQVCRRIRAYAARGPGAEAGLFTYFHEIYALCETGKYASAWRQLLRRDRLLRGDTFDYRSHPWSHEDVHDLRHNYGPLFYMTGRFSEAAAVFERVLEFECCGENASYNAMYTVANNDPEPSNRSRVTLLHCYRRLGRRLSNWSGWRSFVMGMHPKLLRMAKVDRDSMLAAPHLLIKFQVRLQQILLERTEGSGGTWGICDLLDGPAKVKKRHRATVREFKQFQKCIRTQKSQKEKELTEAFGDYTPIPEEFNPSPESAHPKT